MNIFAYGMNSAYRDFWNHNIGYLTGRHTYENTVASNNAQIAYDEYIKKANERALADWHRNVPNREIAYPEFSYAGAIYRADTSIARSMYSNDSAYANYIGNLPYRYAGLYGIGGRASRTL